MFRPYFLSVSSVFLLGAMTLLSGCASNHAPLPQAAYVELDRFMGTWYVVGYSPILVDKQAHNAVEHYYLAENGDIETTYEFRQGAFDGKLKRYNPVGHVHDDTTNAEWRMQFIWPFSSKYIIVYVSDDYTRTIVAHPNRKFAWIMQREPEVNEADYAAMLSKLEAAGFDTDAVVQRLPQDWTGESADRIERVIAASSGQWLAEE